MSLPQMLIVSLALHVSLAAAIALSYFHASALPVMASSPAAEPTMLLLRAEEMPARPFQQLASARAAMARTVETRQPDAVPSPAQPLTEKVSPTVMQSPALALEANPNAHIQALPPEAVLSPNPPPCLNGADGVVFILDISGSMYEPYAGSTRLAYARETLSRRIRALKDGTPFAITLYAQRTCTSGPLVAANAATREAAIRFIMRDVDCGGGTNLPAGLASAGQLHAGAVVLVSDGDLNVSAINLTNKIRGLLGPEGHGSALTVVGVAPRVNAGADRLLQGLADQQDGTYHAEQAESGPSLLTSASSATKPASATP